MKTRSRSFVWWGLVYAAALLGFAFASSAAPPTLGDLDGDGQVTVLDLVRLINHVNGTTALPDNVLPFADINGDGFIEKSDIDGLANLILGIPILPRPVTLEPATGATEVGVTVRPKATFPRPIDVSTLNSNNFYASFAGRKLPATIVPAANGTFAWLFFDPPMPNASQVTVNVDGSTITNLLGAQLDADGDGAPGGVATFNFSTVSVAPVPGTVVATRIVDPGPDLIPRTGDDVMLGPNGIIYLLPIAGVKVYVLGMESNFAYTDTNGSFLLTNMPVGDVKVVLDGRTASNPPSGYYFPEMVMDTTLLPGITNGVMNIVDANGVVMRDTNGVPIRANGMYLPRVASSILQTVNAGSNTLITLNSNAAYNLTPTQAQYLTISVPSNSMVGMNGQPMQTGQVGISVVPPELVQDMLPPGLLQHTFDITVQAPGVATFSTPAQMTFPNVFNAPPGTKLSFLSFDHTTGRLVIEGTATVSADGLLVRTDPGTGITHPGWHGLAPPGKDQGPPPPPQPNPHCDPQRHAACDDAADQELAICSLKCGVDFITDALLCAIAPPPADAYCALIALGKYIVCESLCLYDWNKEQQRCQRDWGCPGSVPAEPAPFAGLTKGTRTPKTPDQINQLLQQAVAVGRPYLGSTNGLPPAVSAQIFDLINQANGLAGGDAPALLTQAALAKENELAPLVESAGEAEGNAPPYPVAYVATLRGASGKFKIRGRTEGRGQYSIFVGSGETIGDVAFYDPVQKAYGLVFPNLRPSAPYALPRFYLMPLDENFADTDGDGLPDVVEDVCGTDATRFSTAGDGISDGEKVAQGLDPLGGGGVANGVIANLALPGEAKEVVIAGSTATSGQQTAYIACGSRGLSIVNVSRFQMPILLGQIDLPGDAGDVAVDSTFQIAVVAANAGGLHFVDVSSPMQPQLLRTIGTNASSVRIIAGVVYAAVGNTIQAYDLLTGQFLQTLALGGASVTGLASEGFFLYAMDAANTLRVIDISGDIMVARGSVTLPAGGGKLFVGNGIAYICAANGTTGGFATAAVSDPDNPALLGGVAAANVEGGAIAANGSGLAVTVGYVRGPQGQSLTALDVLNVSNPTNTGAFVTRHALPVQPYGVAIGAGIAFVANGTAGLQVVNYRSFDTFGVSPTIALSNSFTMTTPTNGIAIEGNLARVSAVTSDDVQVRNVEFYLDGALVASDQSFPFEYLFVTPALSATKTNFTLQARAFDTGGNLTWTPLIVVQLAPDLSPARLRRSFPAVSNVVDTATNVYVYFNKPLNGATLNSATFSLLFAGADHRLDTPDDVLMTNAVVSYLSTLNAGVLSFPAPLPYGLYRATISTNVTDASGNHPTNALSWTFWVLPGGPDGDADHDGLSNTAEVALGTDPLNRDTDGDGWSDLDEAENGTDPLDPKSTPNVPFVARPPVQIELTSSGALGTEGAPVFVARPPIQIDLPSQDSLGKVGAGVFVARPPIQIDLLSADALGSVGAAVYVARPPLEICLPSPETIGTAGVPVFLARPPVQVNLQSADTYGSTGAAVFEARPPIQIDLPSAYSANSVYGTFLALPPVTISSTNSTTSLTPSASARTAIH